MAVGSSVVSRAEPAAFVSVILEDAARDDSVGVDANANKVDAAMERELPYVDGTG